ncbi:aggregation-promoting factor C-terminal-like domain-containing protein [Nocardioides sambongensis]|uniref:aggregation-promoting factor C-terminal-like domain-containing protein n=1 Tax=Nocardioides sambongensis TaxID=2589074 RepID=UPI001126D167|nr:lytic transglycosylase domain-containing protein [Nocardioides sambongensis]
MSKPANPAPKHRGAPRHAHLKEAPKTAARNVLVLSSVAAAVTGVSVGAGVLGEGAGSPAAAPAADIGTVFSGGGTVVEAAADREEVVSRDDQRGAADPAKRASLVEEAPAAMTEARSLSDSDPKDIARALMADFGFSVSEFGCLDSLWTRESGWSVTADNPSSSAYGIPQALPGSKMASAGADWATNPVTQITWGLGYIQDRYGSPCGAWGHSQSVGWY